ncbi:MAG: helix-turn-helix domain-containing protein [Micrococcales bacterium]|nr:helix-turn-helix domain-containing protein [Micrococcales bacterium]
MSQDGTLYEFLTSKLRERGLPVESLPQLIGVSRSTLYRNMKGTVQMSAEVQTRFAELLDLSGSERAEYDRLSSLAAFDPTLVQARHILDQLVFGGDSEPPAKPEAIRFALYGDDTYLRTADQVYEQIRTLVMADDVSTTIHIINCVDDALFQSMSAFLEDLLQHSKTATVEHLLVIPSGDYAAIATTITRLLPLMMSNRYTARYTVEPTATPHPAVSFDGQEAPTPRALFDNAISFQINHADGLKYFLLSFLEDELSVCLTTSDRGVINFFESNYDAIERRFNQALIHSTNIDLFSDTAVDFTPNTAMYAIKSTFGLGRVPVPVFRSMLARLTPDELTRIQKVIADTDDDPAAGLEAVLDSLDRRAQASYQNRHVEVCSCAGLTEFARMGRTSDHLDYLPSFDPSERRSILEYLRGRVSDPKDPYTMYVTREAFVPDGYVITLENIGVVINYNLASYRQGVFNNLFIASRALTEIFTDYLTNHIPQTHALSLKETDVFLANLIKSIE